MKTKSLVAAVLLSFISLFGAGCVAVVAGGAAAGTTAYVMGELRTQVEASAADLRKAIPAAGKELNLREISAEADQLTGKYVFRTGTDEKITITYEVVTDNLAKLDIRVGTFGDEALSRRILRAIEKGL